MDQLKQSLAVAIKYGFWISMVVIFLGSIAIWYVVTGRLVAENEDRTRKIEGSAQTVTMVRGTLPDHPNPTSHDRMNQLIDARREEVLRAWQTVYDAQQDILVWPEKELRKDFVDEFRDLIPIEAFVPFPPGEQEIETTLLNRFKYYIGNALPAIAAIADTQWTQTLDSTSAVTEGFDDDVGYATDTTTRRVNITGAEEGPLVQWPSEAQSELMRELFPWYPNRPSTLEVYYSMENLWILRQLLAIIADVNGDAKQPFEAKIHQIKRLSMGRRVRVGLGTLASPGSAMSGMMMDDMMGDEDYDMSGDDSGMMDAGYGDGGVDGMDGMGMGSTIDPADNRYVDTAMLPITGARLRSAFTSDSPEDAPLKVAKRVPVMMSLQVDQRAIPAVLAACGSAALMVEVKQTRILPSSATGAVQASEFSSGMEDDFDSAPVSTGSSPTNPFPFDVTLEVYGLIHIYNPPEKGKLADDKVTTDTQLDGETMGGEMVPVVEPVEPVIEPATVEPATVEPAAVEPPTNEPVEATPTDPVTEPPAAAATPPAS